MRYTLPLLLAVGLCAQTKDANTRTSPGMTLSATNPQVGGNSTDRRILDANCYSDSTTSTPTFSDENCVQISTVAIFGQQSNGLTNAKKTFLPFYNSSIWYAAGQKFLQFNTGASYGMGDTGVTADILTYAGGPTSGDELQGYRTVTIGQQESLTKTTISSIPTRSSCDTTLTQNVTKSKDPQTVTVASTTGCSVNDWVVVDQAIATGYPNISAFKITAVGAGTLTGVIHNTYTSGTAITPATPLNVASISKFGQDRVLVNLSSTPYTTGTVASIAGAIFTGSGTSWSEDMVGGGALNPGCIALTNDTYSSAPFNGSGSQGPLVSWYQIKAVNSATSLEIHSFSVAGDGSYHGNGVGNGAYTIRPCGRVINWAYGTQAPSNPIIVENNSFTWTVGDSLELAICPYPDTSGEILRYKQFSPGGVRRALIDLTNWGGQTLGPALSISGNMSAAGLPAYGNAINIGALVKRGINIGLTTLGAIQIQTIGAGVDNDQNIRWGGHAMIGPATGPGGSTLQVCASDVSGCYVAPLAPGGTSMSGQLGVKVAVPANAGSNCDAGMWAASTTFLYVCVATATWVRSALATW